MTVVINDLHDRPHIRLLSQLLLGPYTIEEWYDASYDGDNKEHDRTSWYSGMFRLLIEGYMERILYTPRFKITDKGEELLVQIMEMEDDL